MKNSLFQLLAGQRHEFSALVLMRGETFMEAIEEGSTAVLLLLGGSATISRQRAGAQVGLHMTPRAGEPVWLTSPGTYCIVAKDYTFGVRLLRRAGN